MSKITICGSIAFYDEMLDLKSHLEKLAHEVKVPENNFRNQNGSVMSASEFYELRKNADSNSHWLWEVKKKAMVDYFREVELSDAILVANYDKNGIDNYIGGNTLIEMGVALNFGRRIYLLNNIPEVPYKEEILAMQPEIINRDLSLIK